MAMYYQNSSSELIQGDGLHTLYLMNPNYDTQHNMHFFNSAALAPPPQPHQFVGIPLLSHDPTRPPPDPAPAAQNTMAAAARHQCYSMWGSSDNQPNTAQQSTPRGLSLSLSAHHQAGFDRSSISGDRDFPAGQASIGVISPKQRSPPANGVIMGSKYLKAAQELLDEVVNVGNRWPDKKAKAIKDSTAANREAETANTAAVDLTTAQRQEIQMKKAKLNSMLDEVEQRCRQYDQQMQMIIAAFEQAAGTGSAGSYTQLALKTILKQFRCLKSTICGQIKALSKSLGEEEYCEDNNFQVSRLKFVDHQVRQQQQQQQQQLGMIHNNAWRPQRGLPERAVSLLRAWLFQHFLHPYPKDSDKQMLAKQTGLTRSQVSNWFINARVRLWKPMVEEMYLEETKNQQQNASIKPEPEPEPEPDARTPPTAEISPSTASPPGPSLPACTNFAQLITSLNMENLSEKNPKKPRNAFDLSAGAGAHHTNERFSTENYLSMAAANINRYGIGELDQQLAAGFGHGNSFSLSLALPPTGTFLSHRSFEIESEGGRINEGGYEMLDFQNRKPFPPQLLPDFVT